jgi:hypothetical protein
MPTCAGSRGRGVRHEPHRPPDPEQVAERMPPWSAWWVREQCRQQPVEHLRLSKRRFHRGPGRGADHLRHPPGHRAPPHRHRLLTTSRARARTRARRPRLTGHAGDEPRARLTRGAPALAVVTAMWAEWLRPQRQSGSASFHTTGRPAASALRGELPRFTPPQTGLGP